MQSQPDCWDTAVLIIHNAPLLDVLRTQSWLRDEYLDSACFRVPSVTILYVPNDSYMSRGENQEISNGVFARLRTATIFCEFEFGTSGPSRWADIRKFAEVVASKAPKLSTLHIGMRYPGQEGVPHEMLPALARTHSVANRVKFMPPPPNNLMCLPITRRGEGYTLEFVEFPDDFLAHIIVRVGAYVFSREKVHGDLWRPQEHWEKWPTCEYPEAVLRSLDSNETATIPQLHMVREWKDMREDELKTWQAKDVNASL
jgi:hypothetical protein